MKTEYIVIDPEGYVSQNEKTREIEVFKTYRGPKGAAARAKQLAESMPGQAIRIFELTAETIVPVKEAEHSRKHPTEHYK